MEITYNFMLKDLAFYKLAAIFWKQEKPYISRVINKAENGILPLVNLKRVESFLLPKVLENKLKNIIIFMNYELLNWIDQHPVLEKKIETELIVNCLEWTRNGHIDVKKTVINVKNQDIDVDARFEIACFYCFEEELLPLWDQISNKGKEIFLKQCNIVYGYFKYFLRNKLPPHINVSPIDNEDYKTYLTLALMIRNPLAVNYYWNLLKRDCGAPAEQEHITAILNDGKVFYYLVQVFSQINAKITLQGAPLEKNAYVLLRMCLYNWLWDDSFFTLLAAFKGFLTNEHYFLLLYNIQAMMERYPVKDELQSMLSKFWNENKTRILEFYNHAETQGISRVTNRFDNIGAPQLEDWTSLNIGKVIQKVNLN